MFGKNKWNIKGNIGSESTCFNIEILFNVNVIVIYLNLFAYNLERNIKYYLIS